MEDMAVDEDASGPNVNNDGESSAVVDGGHDSDGRAQPEPREGEEDGSARILCSDFMDASVACDASFRYLSNAFSHISTHMDKIGWQCTVRRCRSAPYVNFNSFAQHMLTHTRPIPCEYRVGGLICGKGLYTRWERVRGGLWCVRNALHASVRRICC